MFASRSCLRWRAQLHNPSIRPFFKLRDTRPGPAYLSSLYGPGRTLAAFSKPRSSPFTVRRGSHQYSQYRQYDPGPNNYAFNLTLTSGCIIGAVFVYGFWDYSQNGLIYSVTENLRARLESAGISVPKRLNTRAVYDFLSKYFLLHADDSILSPSWLGAAFSHQNGLHMAVNLFVWYNFAGLLFALPRLHYGTIVVGSALASSAAWVYDADRRSHTGAALGSSGIVSGVMMTATMFYPTAQASLLGIFSMPLWILTGGFLTLDYYFMQSGGSRVGHSAHLGGAAFGFVYYTLFLRKFGGIFGPRRF